MDVQAAATAAKSLYGPTGFAMCDPHSVLFAPAHILGFVDGDGKKVFATSAKTFEDALAAAPNSRAAYYLAAAASKQASYAAASAKLASALGEPFDIYGCLPVAAVELRTPAAPPQPAPQAVRKFGLYLQKSEPEVDLKTAKKKAREFYGRGGYAARSLYTSKNWGSHTIGFADDDGTSYIAGEGYNFREVFAKAPRSKAAFFLGRAQKSQAEFLAALASLEREIGRKVDPRLGLMAMTVDALVISPVAA